jgi:hypothetical protein
MSHRVGWQEVIGVLTNVIFLDVLEEHLACLIPKMKEIRPCETSVTSCQSTLRNIPEDFNLRDLLRHDHIWRDWRKTRITQPRSSVYAFEENIVQYENPQIVCT